jgi:hypothetical protein
LFYIQVNINLNVQKLFYKINGNGVADGKKLIFFLNDLQLRPCNFQCRTNNEKDFKRKCQNLVKYVGFFRNINYYNKDVNLKERFVFYEKIGQHFVIKPLNFINQKIQLTSPENVIIKLQLKFGVDRL